MLEAPAPFGRDLRPHFDNPAGLRVKDKDGNLPPHSAIENGDKIPKSTSKK